MLLGRSKELEYLNQYYRQNRNQLVVLYGGKGVGVTAVREEFSRQKETICLHAYPSAPRQMAYLWSKELISQGISFDEEYPDFELLFETLLQSFIHRNKGKLVLCIEAFHHLIRLDSSFLSALVTLMSKSEYQNSIMIILSGNAVGYIENTFVSQIGTLAYSISGFVKVKPLRFIDLVCYFDIPDIPKCMDFYAISGGIPLHWSYFDGGKTMKENICRLFLRKDAVFYKIGFDIVSDSLREPAVYNTLLAAIAEGKEKLNDIHLHTGFSRAKISVYLKNLMAHEMVEKVFSYEAPGDMNVKKALYRIQNPLLLFWFRFVYPHFGLIETMPPETFYEKFIAPKLSDFTGKVFSKVCGEYLCIMNEQKALPVSFHKFGEWVGKLGTIDFVGQNEKRDTILGFCNCSGDKMSLDDFNHYMELAKQALLKPEHCYLFSVSGFEAELEAFADDRESVYLVDMKQL